MTNKIQKFISEVFGKVRGVYRDGQAWLYAVDICKALKLENVSQAISRLDDDEKCLKNNNPPTIYNSDGSKKGGGTRDYLLVNEPGIYRLIITSRTPEARDFQRWVFHEVLPALRREELREMIRSDGKQTRRELTDVIKTFLEYLKERGELDRLPVAWYTAFSNLADKAAGIEKGQRGTAQPLQLLRVQDAEDKITDTIEEGMAAGKGHHDIWVACQDKLK